MKKAEVQVGATYTAKVSGTIQEVRITGLSTYGGWDARNVKTGRAIRIKGAQRLRRLVCAGDPPRGSVPATELPLERYVAAGITGVLTPSPDDTRCPLCDGPASRVWPPGKPEVWYYRCAGCRHKWDRPGEESTTAIVPTPQPPPDDGTIASPNASEVEAPVTGDDVMAKKSKSSTSKPRKPRTAKAEGTDNGKVSTAKPKDQFGSREGTKGARVNAVLTKTPQGGSEIFKAAGLKDGETCYNHLNGLVEKGLVTKSKEGYAIA